jgi:uncharacterized protein
MATLTQHAPGTFCWPELLTTDRDGAKKFYTSLFGWTFQDNPTGPATAYTIFKLGGRDVAGCFQMTAEMEGMAPNWMSYVAVESADRAAQKAKQLGGRVTKEPFDVPEVGRMAALQDPSGAHFCLWQSSKHPGVGVLDEPGALCWTELLTADPGKAAPFYTQLFGWKDEAWPGPKPYTVFKNGDKMTAGMMRKPPEMGEAPSRWMPYMQVEACDRSAARAQQLGAAIVMPPTDIPEVGRFAIVSDPQGAVISMLQMPESS